MKSKMFLTVAAGMLLLVASAFSQARKKVAVVTFYCDKWIDMTDLGSGTASMVSSMGTLTEDPDFDLKPVLTKFHDVFFNEYAKSFPFDLIPESEVISDPAYMAYESKWGETEDKDRNKLMQRYEVVPGYKPLTEVWGKDENKNEMRMLELFGDRVDGVMFVYLDFSFTPKVAIGGMGTCGVKGFCRMKLWDKEGKKVFAVNEFANSKKTVGMVAGIPTISTREILPMCNDASDQVIEDLRKRIGKICEKVDKKF